jgi:hypothetical protein
MVVSVDEHRLRLSPEQPDQNSHLTTFRKAKAPPHVLVDNYYGTALLFVTPFHGLAFMTDDEDFLEVAKATPATDTLAYVCRWLGLFAGLGSLVWCAVYLPR